MEDTVFQPRAGRLLQAGDRDSWGNRRHVLLVTAVALTLLSTGCGSGVTAVEPAPRLAADVVQQRGDDVRQRVDVAMTNRSDELVTIESIDLRVPGYTGAGTQLKDSPIPAGQQVNLRTPYGKVSCNSEGAAHVERPESPWSFTQAVTPSGVELCCDLEIPRGCSGESPPASA